MCIICGEHLAVRKKQYCAHCSKRVITWGLNGATKLLNIARCNNDLSIDEVMDFCKTYYIGKSSKLHVQSNTLKTSLKMLGYTGKVIGRMKRFSDYRHIERASIQRQYKYKDNECWECGSKEDLHIHHIVPQKWGGSIFAPDEVLTLCSKCHRKHHKEINKILTKDLLIAYLSPYRNEICKKARSIIKPKIEIFD